MERSRRNVQSRTAKLAGVLADLQAAREGSGKRATTYEVRQEDAVFDVVDEEQYEQLVAKRRLETGARGARRGARRARARKSAALCAARATPGCRARMRGMRTRGPSAPRPCRPLPRSRVC